MIFLLLLLIYCTYLFQIRNRRNTVAQLAPPPGPPQLPLIRNLHQIGTAKEPHIYLWQLSRKYGPLMQLKFGSLPIIVVSSAKLAKQVLKTQDLAFCSRPKFLGQQKLSYNGIDMAFSPYNDYWREMRKITSIHLFSLKKTQSFRFVREDEISRLVNKISGFASSNQPVNRSKIAMVIGSTLICKIAFGKRYDEQGLEYWRFQELLHEVQALVAGFYVSDYFPKFGWIDRITGMINRLDKTFNNLDSFYQELIDEHLVDRTRVEKTEEDYDVLDILIQLKEKKTCSVDLE